MGGMIPAVSADPALWEALEAGYTLPARWYTSTDIFRLEQRRIFRRSWQYTGLTEQVSQPGDFFTYQTGDL